MVTSEVENLDDPKLYAEKRSQILSKQALKDVYLQAYNFLAEAIRSAPREGSIIEIGSGAGFLKEYIPQVISTDVIQYQGLDRILDATNMDLPNKSVSVFFVMNTFHHIPDVEKFLNEAQRTLKPGGKIILWDQHVGIFSYFILKYFHHEAFDKNSEDWSFPSHGPLSSANGALAWLVFRRDIEKFRQKFPQLKLDFYEPVAPLQYWFSGGLKEWNLIPDFLLGAFRTLDNLLLKINRNFGSFVKIQISLV